MASMGPASAPNPSPNDNYGNGNDHGNVNVTNIHANANTNNANSTSTSTSTSTPASNPRHSTAFVSFSSLRSSARRITNSLSPVKQTEPHVFSGKESPPRFSTDRSSTSSRSSQQPLLRTRAASSSTASLPYFVDQNTTPQKPTRHHPSASATLPTQSPPRGLHRVDAILPSLPRAATSSAIPHASAHQPASSVAMMATPFGSSFRPENGKPPSISQSNSGFGQGGSSAPLPGTGLSAGYAFAPPGNVQNPNAVYQHIQDISAKRISTLAYLKKAHEGRVYWFNTLLFSKSDLSKMPYFEVRKLARRATNYLLLGLSLPTILDLNASTALEYLRTLNALLLEFESYQQIHTPEGASSSSLSRARIPQMFKRATHATGPKGRRTSSATEIGLPMNTSDPTDLKSMTNGGSGTGASSGSSFPISEQELLPGEEYTHLLTPSLPFDPDFFETFTTLCDVLIDCYTRITSLVPSPAVCAPGLGEIFAKADGRLRKVIITGIVKEFEEASRSGAKSELAGVSRVVLGGLV
ncbi:hypothetical protein MMC22_006804 [Lobaria immixta]|nr:hypothetical protein [Lobaria immixta]